MDMRAWLTTVVGRICLDMLRARKTHPVKYVGPWLPEPVVKVPAADGPEEQAVMADSVGLALLVVLESLTPAERLAFVLHDVFDMRFDEVGHVMGRTEGATSQAPAPGRYGRVRMTHSRLLPARAPARRRRRRWERSGTRAGCRCDQDNNDET